ncbi:endonuclease/exonuclease/phosphatase family protein [uncultured Odoribacter sp.]|uniref:endonuclease/exonuclease/phosphatase family protein n=1 Tax=uncultured Odoribacter sp. TaxID=876416 RepID=UPI0026019C94|nr:endonuclease/exonuclease/phosphatase family protein [uncultured Odoribacter sp.]
MAALRFFFYLLMKPAALGFALLGLVGLLAPFTDPNKWWVPAFSGLFMPLLLVGNFLLFLFWIFQKKWWALLPLLTILLNYNFFKAMFQSPWKDLPEISRGKQITVASYNVEGFYYIARNPQYNIKQFVKDNHIDILCIQEHCEEADLDTNYIKTRLGLPYRRVFFNRQTDWANFGISIYSRYPIIRDGKIDFNSEKNSSMWTDIKIQNDTIRVFNNHLQTTDVNINREKYEKYKSVKNWKGQARTLVKLLGQLKENFQIRAEQARQVREIIDITPYPVIVCGDFNDTPISFAYNHIKGNHLLDGFQNCGKGYGHTFNGIKGLLRIDFVAYDTLFKGISYESPHLPWSDHNPILMKLSLSSAPSPDRTPE